MRTAKASIKRNQKSLGVKCALCGVIENKKSLFVCPVCINYRKKPQSDEDS